MMQVTFGDMLVMQARRCWDLTAAVPEEYEAALWEEADAAIQGASLFGSQDADFHLEAYGLMSRKPT